jgi:FtsZ-interacting cell division protein YlmF
MARGGLSKFLEFIGLVDDEPETAYNRQPAGGQTYTPPRRGAENARPVRPQPGYGAGYASQGAYGQSAYAQGASSREYDRYGGRDAAEPRPSYRSAAAGEYRSGRFEPDPPRQAPRQDYSARPAQPARPAAPYRSDPIRDEFERIEQPLQPRSNVIAMQNDSRHQTVIYYLHTLEECRDVITDLMDSKTVLLNLEEMEEKTIQRGIDTLCGAAFALGATLRKASDKTYLIAPNNVEVAMTNEADRRY